MSLPQKLHIYFTDLKLNIFKKYFIADKDLKHDSFLHMGEAAHL